MAPCLGVTTICRTRIFVVTDAGNAWAARTALADVIVGAGVAVRACGRIVCKHAAFARIATVVGAWIAIVAGNRLAS